MNTLSDLAENLERDLAWREDEISFLERLSSNSAEGFDKNCVSRSLVVTLYAHFEGFTKNTLLSYVTFINSHSLTCGQVNAVIAVAALEDVFHALRNQASKCDLFRDRLPDDTKLHRVARETEFLSRTHQWKGLPVRIPEDIIDAEDNLKPDVLSKMLYRLGLPHNSFVTLKGQIDMLLGFRNAVAHGDKRTIDAGDLSRLKRSVRHILTKVKSDVLTAAGTRSFILNSPN